MAEVKLGARWESLISILNFVSLKK